MEPFLGHRIRTSTMWTSEIMEGSEVTLLHLNYPEALKTSWAKSMTAWKWVFLIRFGFTYNTFLWDLDLVFVFVSQSIGTAFCTSHDGLIFINTFETEGVPTLKSSVFDDSIVALDAKHLGHKIILWDLVLSKSFL